MELLDVRSFKRALARGVPKNLRILQQLILGLVLTQNHHNRCAKNSCRNSKRRKTSKSVANDTPESRSCPRPTGGLSPRRDGLFRADVRHIERIFGPELTRVGGALLRGKYSDLRCPSVSPDRAVQMMTAAIPRHASDRDRRAETAYSQRAEEGGRNGT